MSNDTRAPTSLLTSSEVEELRTFLRDHVSSFEQLAALLFFARAPRRSWRSSDLSSALDLPEEVVDGALVGMSERLVLRQRSTGTRPIYHYAPHAELEPLIERLANAYSEHRLTIVQIMTSNAMARVRGGAAQRVAVAFRQERSKK
jgi:hypothetical protein